MPLLHLPMCTCAGAATPYTAYGVIHRSRTFRFTDGFVKYNVYCVTYLLIAYNNETK